MKSCFSILLILICIKLKSQNNTCNNCLLIQKSVESVEFKKHFHLNKFKMEQVLMIDTLNYFSSNCNFTLKYEQKKIEIINKWRINKDSLRLNCNQIFIVSLKIEKSINKLVFFQPCSNAVFTIVFKKTKKIKIKSIDCGVL